MNTTYKQYKVQPVDIDDILMQKLYHTDCWSAQGEGKLYFDSSTLAELLDDTNVDADIFSPLDKEFLFDQINLLEDEGDLLFMT